MSGYEGSHQDWLEDRASHELELEAYRRERAVAAAPHDCGLCDSPLVFDGVLGDGTLTFRCTVCEWWHCATDCCQPIPEPLSILAQLGPKQAAIFAQAILSEVEIYELDGGRPAEPDEIF